MKSSKCNWQCSSMFSHKYCAFHKTELMNGESYLLLSIAHSWCKAKILWPIWLADVVSYTGGADLISVKLSHLTH